MTTARRQEVTDRRTQRIALAGRGHSKFHECLALWRTNQEALALLYGEEWSETLRAAVLTIAQDDRRGTMVGMARDDDCADGGTAGRHRLGCFDHRKLGPRSRASIARR
jgi:hypothetical protein